MERHSCCAGTAAALTGLWPCYFPCLTPRLAPACLMSSLVLIPHGGEDFCTLDASFTSFVDPRKFGPRLNVHVQVRGGLVPLGCCWE